MKDSSVGPVGLFDNRRQQRLLDGLNDRFRSCVDQQQHLQGKHAEEEKQEEREFSEIRSKATMECRTQRRDMLNEWDQAEEKLVSDYEATVINTRRDLNRLAAMFRRKSDEQKKIIEKKFAARRKSVLDQYESRKNQPGQQKRKDHRRIDEALKVIHGHQEFCRALTIRRLDRLPKVDVEELSNGELSNGELSADPPDSVQGAIDRIEQLTLNCNQVNAEMQSGVASRVVDSMILPAGVAVLVVIWAVVAYFVAPPPPWLWMAAGLIPVGLLGFTIYLIMLWPLKRMTRKLYPEVESLVYVAEHVGKMGKRVSAETAEKAAAELVAKRDSQVSAAKRTRGDELEQMEKTLHAEQERARHSLLATLRQADDSYSQNAVEVDHQMRTRADGVAEQITKRLSDTDTQVDRQRDENRVKRHDQLQHLASRLRDGVRRGLHQIDLSTQQVNERFPDWSEVVSGNAPAGNLDFLPLGWLKVDDRLNHLSHPPALAANGNAGVDPASPSVDQLIGSIPEQMPVVLHRRLHSAVVIRTPQAFLEQATELAHQVLWRALSGASPSRAKLTLIDPLGRGQHFTSFMALADHDPTLVGHRVWTTDSKIDERLGELAHHVEDVLQASLRDRFERIEDYNQMAGTMAEPYRMIAAIGFPEGLSRDSYRHLGALLQAGLRCGIFTVLVCDESKPWPADIPLPTGEKVLPLRIDDDGQWRLDLDGLRELPFHPAPAPPVALRNELVERIGQSAVAASRVEIPLESILSAEGEANGSTDDGVDIVIGSQGADRSLSLKLGEGVRQHVLIAGKTGSGKSTLLHSIITSGAHHYQPDELEFYLLDFKKGVEFKPYADSEIPHARVIGIESEREFGRSVLQRLDVELQQRGEKFRAAAVQELADYRRATGEKLPRILLVVDEFQELFIRDDRLAGDCTMLLDRLVRQGRSFGMHVILSSQSLAGAYSLPRATLGQMAVRIAMQCSESDAALILSDDNTAARLISRPGEAIYNDAGGLVEGNQPFQVAWLSSDQHRDMLKSLATRDRSFTESLPPSVVFEGNRPCRWTPPLASSASSDGHGFAGLLGESVELGPPISLELSRNNGRNVLVIASQEARSALLASAVSGLAKSDPRLEVRYFDGNRVDDGPSAAPWLEAAGLNVRTIKPRDCEEEMRQLAALITERGDDAENAPPILCVIDPMERFRDLRQDDSFNFSLDAAGGQVSGSSALQQVLRDGPAAGVFLLVVCGSAETLSRWLPRASQHDLELRILGQMNQSDSALLIDSPMASDLSAATMLMYDDSDGRISKFRQTDLPDSDAVKDWLAG